MSAHLQRPAVLGKVRTVGRLPTAERILYVVGDEQSVLIMSTKEGFIVRITMAITLCIPKNPSNHGSAYCWESDLREEKKENLYPPDEHDFVGKGIKYKRWNTARHGLLS